MPALTTDELRKLCKLARLNPELEDLNALSGHFDRMLGHMDALRALDLSDVEPLIRLDEIEGHLRPDVVHPSLSREEAFRNAPTEEFNHFAIPKVIGA